MASKKTEFTGFGDSWQAPTQPKTEEVDLRTKAKGETVHISLRLTKDQWKRAKDLADIEGTSIQRLAVHGISKLLEEKGLPGL